MKPRFYSHLLVPLLLAASVGHAGISVTGPQDGLTGGTFIVHYGLGSPYPGKIAYVSVTKPDGSHSTIGQAENVPDFSQTCSLSAGLQGTYQFFYEYSFESEGIPRTVVYQQNHSVSLNHAPTTTGVSGGTTYAGINNAASPGQATTISGSATDANGNLSLLDFYVNPPNWSGWQHVGSASVSGSPASGSVTWNVPADAQRGTWAIHVRARDSLGVMDSNGTITSQVVVKWQQPAVALSPQSLSVSVNTAFSPFEAGPPWPAGGGSGALQFVVSNHTNWGGTAPGTLLPPGNTPSATWTPTAVSAPGSPYAFWIRRAGDADYFDSDPAGPYSLTVNGVPPTITVPPASQSATAGSTVTFGVTATGSAPLTYQWRKGGSDLSGANSATLTLTNVQSANGGSYDVVVTNSGGTVTSAAATLNVTSAPVAPTIIAQPASLTVAAGGSASFSVTATGTTPFSYVWRKDGTPISGATLSTLSLANVQSADAGNYMVDVSNSGGAKSSNNATLTVTTIGGPPNGPSAPAAPTAVAVTSSSAAGFTIVWDAVAAATGYRVDVATDSGFANILNAYSNVNVTAGTSLTVTGLNAGTYYYYRVRAYNSSNIPSANVTGPPALTGLVLRVHRPSAQ